MSAQLPAIPHIPTHSGVAAEVRLRQLGVPGSTVLVDAVRDGASGCRATTQFHPAGYSGQRMWGETVNSARRGLIPHGWDKETTNGVDLTVNRALGVAIVVVSGDSSTGYDKLMPQSRYEHPRVLREIAGGWLDTLFDSPSERPHWSVWFLLHHVAPGSVEAELSNPVGIDPKGWVIGWQERILLPTQTFGTTSTGSGTGAATRSTPAAVNVPVRRRAV